MQFLKGDMWSAYDEADLFLITANSFVKQNGKLAMGQGIAAEALHRFPTIDYRLGQSVEMMGKHLGVYGLLVSYNWERGQKLGLFQTKRTYRDEAELRIIEASTEALMDWCKHHPGAVVHLNYPGIGYGHLDPSEVLPIIIWLPDTVSVWTK